MKHNGGPASEKSWVLITEASGGFGEEFARQYTAQGHPLVLVARRLDFLQDLAEALRRQYRVEVIVEQVDLSDIAAVVRLHQRLRERGIAIDILINNAGHGLQGPFLDAPLDAALAMVQLDVASLDRRPLMGIGLMAGWLAVCLMVAGCSKPAAKDPRLQPPTVKVFKIEAAEPKDRTFTGVVEARVQSDLGFRVGGKILVRSVDVGQRVRKGQVLMRLDSVDLDLELAAQQANVEAARARYAQAKEEETRSATLVRSNAVSRQEYDGARAALDSTRAQLEAAEAQARVSNNSSGYAVLSADADGVIVRTSSEPGQVVSAGQTVIRLAHDGPREVLINLPEGVRPDLGTIARARLYGQDQMYQTRLRQLSEAADPASRTFEARYVFEGEAASTPLGSTVTVTLFTGQVSGDQSVRLPAGAVHDRGSGPGVWIVDDKSEVKFRAVEIASIGQEEVVVSHGVQVGEKLVSLGAHLLHEGQAVNQANEGKGSYGKF